MRIPFALPLAALFALSLAGCQSDGGGDGGPPAPAPAASGGAPAAAPQRLTPLPGKESTAPKLTEVTKVRLATTAGDVVIEVYPQAGPNAAKRFLELVTTGFFDDTPISRVVPGFVAQFGVNWRAPHNAYKTREFIDDPSWFALERGTLAFAKAGQPNTASTQLFINYADNTRLAAPQPNLSFWAFGKVVEGMDVVDKFVQVGDPSGGLDQGRLWADGGAYLESLPVKPTMITKATVE
jgi:cyclophilin family peptidyl-prolyl cis-trans isomerase